MGEMADAIRESTATIVALRAENARLQERGKEAWKWAMFLRQFANLTLVRERDEAQGKLDAVEKANAPHLDGCPGPTYCTLPAEIVRILKGEKVAE